MRGAGAYYFTSSLFCLLVSNVLAAPVSVSRQNILTSPLLVARDASPVLALSPDQSKTYDPYTSYASAAYCNPKDTVTWTCGANCDANKDFKPVAVGGNGVTTQFWFVGYDSRLNTTIVAHQGTHMASIIPLLIDAQFSRGDLDEDLFPGLNDTIGVHTGFRGTHERSASKVLAAVNKTMNLYKSTEITIVGHSLGAAIALLDAVFLPLHLPNTTTIKYIGYGLPRVGNEEFANYVDTHVSNVTYITNRRDPVPLLPASFAGFHHPHGELHIDYPSGGWYPCSEIESDDEHCHSGDATNIFKTDLDDHSGPYGDVTIGCT